MRLDVKIGSNINYVRAFTTKYWKSGDYYHCLHRVDYYEVVRNSDGSIRELKSLTNNWDYYQAERYFLHIVEEVEEITDFDKPIKYKEINIY